MSESLLGKRKHSDSFEQSEYVPSSKRRETRRKELMSSSISLGSKRELERRKQAAARAKASMVGKETISLVDKHAILLKQGKAPVITDEKKEEDDLALVDATRKAFITNEEYAKGISYTRSMKTSWFPPYKYLSMTPEKRASILKKFDIEVNGEKPIVPPISSFRGMRFPKSLINGLKSKNIEKPTPIQMQALPVCLSGRDCIGIAYTGSGKTLVFALPMIMLCYEEEIRMSLVNGEGPLGVIICPSRELATQTYENVVYFSNCLNNDKVQLRTLLCIGGIDFDSQRDVLLNGVHMVVATPGRLKDTLTKKKLNFNLLKYWCLDEADRLMDTGFEDDIRDILSFVKLGHQIQKVFFSATMPPKVKDLASKSMVRPVVINVGRAGAASMDVIQEVEYVKDEAKIVYLLECLKKTSPPVLIFASNQSDVDDITEYLLIKGIDCASIHGGKSQEERKVAISKFKSQTTDVLVATDVISKGIDLPDIKHVINFDMPKEIEDYIHRIGRTGRCGKTGVATTFININVPHVTLLDLKGLLLEAKQAIPPILVSIGGQYNDINGIVGCAYCSGVGHRFKDCPKWAAKRKGKNKGFIDDKMMLARD